MCVSFLVCIPETNDTTHLVPRVATEKFDESFVVKFCGIFKWRHITTHIYYYSINNFDFKRWIPFVIPAQAGIGSLLSLRA
jgi:hypothetical protein